MLFKTGRTALLAVIFWILDVQRPQFNHVFVKSWNSRRMQKHKYRKKTRKQSMHPNNFENQSNARWVILRLFYASLCNHAELLFLAVLQNVSSIIFDHFFMHFINSAASKTLPAQVKIERHISCYFLKFKSADLRRFLTQNSKIA